MINNLKITNDLDCRTISWDVSSLPHQKNEIRKLVDLTSIIGSVTSFGQVCPLVGQMVGVSVGRSVIIEGGKLHIHAPIGAFVLFRRAATSTD